MEYFIGYLIQGDAKTWHREVSKKISEKFKTWEIHEKIPPHITIFRPFNTGDINSVKSLLLEWAHNYSGSDIFNMVDFGYFDEKVIFAEMVTNESLVKAV